MKHFVDITFDKYKNILIAKKNKVIWGEREHVINAKNVSYRHLIKNKLYRILDNLHEEKNKQLDNNDAYNKNIEVVDNNKNNNQIPYETDVRSEEYKKLSNEEKLNVVRNKLSELFENTTGKVIVVIYKGQKKKINKDKQGEYKDLVEREKKLGQIINKKDMVVQKVNNNVKNKTSFYNKFIIPFINNNINNIGDLFLKIKNVSNKNLKNNKIKGLKNVKTKLEKNKKSKIVNGKKRITAGFCALIIFITGFSLSKCNKNSPDGVNSLMTSMSQNNDNNNLDNTTNEDIYIENNNNNNIENDENKENDNNINNEDKETNNNESGKYDDFKLTFDNTVTININSYIYTNSYDATYNKNSLNPYYSGYYERDVQGLVYSLDGKIYVIYETDVDALEKQRKLENCGAIMTAVLVTREDKVHTCEYEGYYNISSVKVKSR